MGIFSSKVKPSGKLGSESIRAGLTNSSPMLIILCFISSLLLLGVIKFNYQYHLFEVFGSTVSFWVSILFSIVVQLGRMAFGFVGVRDLVRGKWVIGALGIGASIAITLFEHTEVNRMVEYWGNEHLRFPFLFLVWIALIFELRLIMTMTGTSDADIEYQKQLKEAEAAEEKRVAEQTAQIEKHFRLQYEIRSKEDELLRQGRYIAKRQADMEQEEKERQQRYNKEMEAMKARRIQEEKERAARYKQEEAERQARKARKLAKKKRKVLNPKRPKSALGNEKLNGVPA